jgi:hypothetical protein
VRGIILSKVLIALGVGIIMALLLPAWLLVFVLGAILVIIGICKFRC